jgi:uncharacterized phiE125 gp8 family phage protein
MLAPVRTVPPAITPVSLAEVKGHLRVDHTDDDVMIGSLITAAVNHFDGWAGILGRCLVEQTWRQDFPCFSDCLRLPLAPVLSIESVTYFDGSNVSQTLAASVYGLFSNARGAYLGLKPDQSWPGSYLRRDAVSVTFKAGYATTPAAGGVPAQSTVPDPVKLAIIMHVKANYDPIEAGDQESYQKKIDRLIGPLRRVGV